MRIVAHRGGARRGIENTLTAFARAVSDGCDAFECDVRLSADREPVIIHDDDLRRLTGRRASVATTRFAELRTLRVLGSDQKIPHLDEVLELATAHGVECVIELKAGSEALADIVADALVRSRASPAPWVMAFATHRRVLRYIKGIVPRIKTDAIALWPVDLCRTAARCQADAVSFGYGWRLRSYLLFRATDACTRLDRIVNAARDRGISVGAGIANEAGDVLRIARYGVDAIFTDDVPEVRRVLGLPV